MAVMREDTPRTRSLRPTGKRPSTLDEETVSAPKRGPGRPKKDDMVESKVRCRRSVKERFTNEADDLGLTLGDYLADLLDRQRRAVPPAREAAEGMTVRFDLWMKQAYADALQKAAAEKGETISALLQRAMMIGGTVDALTAEVARLKAELAKR